MNANGPSDQELILIAVCGGVFAVYLLIRILFLRMLHRCLSRIHPRNRRMQPAMVWLDLVPLFNYVWGFIIVNRVADSLDDEFYDRRIRRNPDDFGKSIGIACNVCLVIWMWACSVLLIPGLILWIIYWVKIARCSSDLAADAERHGEDFEEYDAPE